MEPWGKLSWLIEKIGPKDWSLLSSISFEPRCTAVPEWYARKFPSELGKMRFIHIRDVQSEYSDRAEQLTSENFQRLQKSVNSSLSPAHVMEILESPSNMSLVLERFLENTESVILDVSTLPKRFFLFYIKQILRKSNIKDFVVCYSQPKQYKEGSLAEHALPPSPLPGFTREAGDGQRRILVLGVGYAGFDINELMESTRGPELKVLLPFPPGSPSFRRTWNLVSRLLPESSAVPELKRMHSMDMFAVLAWLKSLNTAEDVDIDMVPLGPKPHAIAMALAYLGMQRGSVIYAQPQVYRPDYSSGVLLDRESNPSIYGYCLRRDFVNYY